MMIFVALRRDKLLLFYGNSVFSIHMRFLLQDPLCQNFQTYHIDNELSSFIFFFFLQCRFSFSTLFFSHRK